MTTTWIRVAYGVVLALVLLFTVQTGVAMALPGPKPPEDPGITFRQLTAGESEQSQNTLTATIDRYFADSKDYRDDFVDYQRNTFLAGAGLAALLALIGLVLPAAVNYLRFGLLLGAAFTLLWAGWVTLQPAPQPAPPAESILALVAAGEPKQLEFASRFLRFALSFVGLILLLFIGLWRLTEWPATRRTTVSPTTSPAPAPVVATPAASTPSPVAASWAPQPAVASAPAAADTTTVLSEPSREEASRGEPPAGEAGRWQRPSEGGEPARAPDTTA